MTVESIPNVSSPSAVTDSPKETVNNTTIRAPSPAAEAPVSKPSPAADLREIQNLLVNGIFPGQVAPSIVKSFQLLEKMAQQIEQAVIPPKAVEELK
jgi:hypothetical protein